MGSIWMGMFCLLRLVYEWGEVRRLQPHVRIQNHDKLPPPPRKKNFMHQTYDVGISQ